MNIKNIQNEIVDESDLFDTWMDKYEYLIELGKSIPLISQDKKTNDNIIILDAYNANPSSMKSMLSSFAKQEYDNKLCILGDMLELGEETLKEHKSLVKLTKDLNNKLLEAEENNKKISKILAETDIIKNSIADPKASEKRINEEVVNMFNGINTATK